MSGFPAITETLIDYKAVIDIFNAIIYRSEVKHARDSHQDMFWRVPDITILSDIGGPLNPDWKTVLQSSWLNAMKRADDWYHAVGLVPFIKRQVKDTQHVKIIIPDHIDGIIKVRWDPKKRERSYTWTWKGEQNPDKKVEFWVSDDAPDSKGFLRSKLVSILGLVRKVRIAEQCELDANWQASHLPVFFEQKGVRNAQQDIQVLNAFGSLYQSTIDANQEHVNSQMPRVRMSQMQAAIEQAEMESHGLRIGNQTQTKAELEAQSGKRFYDNRLYLPEGWSYKAPQKPSVLVDPAVLRRELRTEAASAYNFSIEWSQPVGRQTTSNIEGMKSFYREKHKQTVERIIQQWKFFFFSAYGQLIIDMHDIDLEEMEEVVDVKKGFMLVEKEKTVNGKKQKGNSTNRKSIMPGAIVDDRLPQPQERKVEQREEQTLDQFKRSQAAKKRKRGNTNAKEKETVLKKIKTSKALTIKKRYLLEKKIPIEFTMKMPAITDYSHLRALRLDGVITHPQFLKEARTNSGLNFMDYDPRDDDSLMNYKLIEERKMILEEKKAKDAEKKANQARKQSSQIALLAAGLSNSKRERDEEDEEEDKTPKKKQKKGSKAAKDEKESEEKSASG